MTAAAVHYFFPKIHSVFSDEKIRSLKERELYLLEVFLSLMAYGHCIQDDHGMKIFINPGQYLTSTRRLAELCNKNKPTYLRPFTHTAVIRGLKKLQELGIVFQEVRHKKTLISCLIPEYLEMLEQNMKKRNSDSVPQNKIIISNKETYNDNRQAARPPDIPKIAAPLSSSHQINEDIEAFQAFCELNDLKIEDRDFVMWLKKHPPDRIHRNLVLLSKKKDSIINVAGWLSVAIKKDYAGTIDNTFVNKRFAEEIKRKSEWHNLSIKEQYCVDEITGNDYQYSLPPPQFAEMLRRRYAANLRLK